MDNSPIFSKPQEYLERPWKRMGAIAGFTALGSAILLVLLITFSTRINPNGLSSLISIANILGIIAIFGSLTGIVLNIMGFAQNTVKPIGGIALNITLLIMASLLRSAYVSIQPDERGVVISALQPTGYRPQALQPGLYWVLPFLESTQIYSVAPQTYIVSSTPAAGDEAILVRTRDGRRFKISARVTYSIDPAKVIQLHVFWQDRYLEGVVRPLVRTFIRDGASKYTALELTGSGKAMMENTALKELTAQFAENNMILLNFEILDVQQGN